MFATKNKGVLAIGLVVGLALGGIGLGVVLSTNPMALAQEKTGDQALDGLWEDSENKGGWFHFDGSTIKYHPAGKSEEMWTCRYNLTLTPMTIDIFRNNRTDHGIFVVERGTLFIALATPGNERPTRFQRDEKTMLYVLKRKKADENPLATRKPVDKGAMPKVVSGQLIVHGILDSVDTKKSVVTVKAMVGNDASSVMRLLALLADKKPDKGGTADALLKEIGPDNSPRLVNVPVRADGDGVIGRGVGFAKMKLKMKDLKAGQVVMLQLAADRTTGFVVNYVRVVSDGEEKKPAPKADDGKREFAQVVWVQNKAPQLSVLYVLVPDLAKELPEVNKFVLLYAPLALREAERLTGPDERKLPRFKGEFTITFLIPNAKDGKQALATGFSVEQLREYTSVPQETALKELGRHAWTHQKLPLIHAGP